MVCMDHRLQCTTTEFYKPYISKLGTRANVHIGKFMYCAGHRLQCKTSEFHKP